MTLSNNIKIKASKEWDKNAKAIEQTRNLMNIQSFIGNKTEQLVQKFAMNLLKKVRDKRDKELMRTSEKFVKKIITQLDHI